VSCEDLLTGGDELTLGVCEYLATHNLLLEINDGHIVNVIKEDLTEEGDSDNNNCRKNSKRKNERGKKARK
jgi:hypothetical protein